MVAGFKLSSAQVQSAGSGRRLGLTAAAKARTPVTAATMRRVEGGRPKAAAPAPTPARGLKVVHGTDDPESIIPLEDEPDTDVLRNF